MSDTHIAKVLLWDQGNQAPQDQLTESVVQDAIEALYELRDKVQKENWYDEGARRNVLWGIDMSVQKMGEKIKMLESESYYKEYPTPEELHIKNTKLVGQFKHVIRLYYPCSMFEDVRGLHGEPPTMEKLATAFARHRNECTDGCHV